MAATHRGARVLVLAKESKVAELATRSLRHDGYIVDLAVADLAGVRHALADPPDLALVDSAHAPQDGLEVCRRLRLFLRIPVVTVVRKTREEDGIAALNLGADDYLVEPLSPGELTARIGAVLRRANGIATGALPMRLRSHDLDVDVAAHEARVADTPVALSPKEFALLVHLMRNPRRVLTRRRLLEEVWGRRTGSTATVTVHVRWLRAKIEIDPSQPRHIQTVPRVGYRFEP